MENALNKVEALVEGAALLESFSARMARLGLKLARDKTTTLQINTGLLCNQVCLHCHLEAGPGRPEMMGANTMDEVIAFAGRNHFQAIDITGGAPELNPLLPDMIAQLAPLAPRIMLRSNLTAIMDKQRDYLMELCRSNHVVLIASLPSLNKNQAESQRGKGIFEISINALRRLNSMGYGQADSNLELNLVANATGAFLPASQNQAEKKFRQDLNRKWGIVFNNLHTFANVPLGRFRQWLIKTGNYSKYMQKLAESFNPCTLDGLMCRTLISVSWDGHLFDCDFNLAGRLFAGGRQMHVSQLDGPPEPGISISVADHCYACTAGSGFT